MNSLNTRDRKQRRLYILLFAAILLMQIVTVIYWARQKSNYYVDELYSMGYAHFFTEATPHPVYITESELWQEEHWIRNSDLKKLLITTKEESVFSQSPGKTLWAMWSGRSFHGILNAFESVLAPGQISKRPGTGLNLIFFILTQICLLSIFKLLDLSHISSLFGVAMYGFSGMATGIAIYTRFYCYTIFLFMLAIFLHLKMWKSSAPKVWILSVFFSDLALFLAIGNSELIIAMGGVFCSLFALGLLLSRRKAAFFGYVCSIIGGCFWYAAEYTGILNVFLHPSAYRDAGGAKGAAVRSFYQATADSILSRLSAYHEWITKGLYGSSFVFQCFFAFVLILTGIVIGRHDKREKGAPSFQPDDDAAFIVILAAGIVVYMFFAAKIGLQSSRYLSFIFPLLCIVLWYCIDKLLKCCDPGYSVIILPSVFLAVGVLTTHLSGSIEYVYREDRELIADLKAYSDSSVIMICSRGNSRHEVYDCISLMQGQAKIYPVSGERHKINVMECPDEMLIWINSGTDITPYVEDLEEYSMSLLGRTHVSDVFLAVKQPE